VGFVPALAASTTSPAPAQLLRDTVNLNRQPCDSERHGDVLHREVIGEERCVALEC
ncbi:uncharacterized protein METZ01_LOCUS105497, partial [marine metagenome]